MNFIPEKEQAEAGISIFQQDNNYINFTIEKNKTGSVLKLSIKGREKDLEVRKQEIISTYKGEIIFKVIAKGDKYQYHYSLNGGENFILFSETESNIVICKGYIGTNVGIYATSNGNFTKEYADFDWVTYKGFQKH